MLIQYYFKRLKLFKISYNTLLSYHAPAGNSLKNWCHFQALPHILAVRREIHILSMTFTVINLRRALNGLFQRINTRGTLLIHAQASNGLNINHAAVFSFVTHWLPGILTNYKKVIKSIRRHKNFYNILNVYLKRPQLNNLDNTTLNINPIAKKRLRTRRKKVPTLPSISLSLSDSSIWLNETNCLKIPSIQLCDTQSPLQKISFPILANQRSVTFNYLLLSLFSETCSFSLLYEHLFFINYIKKIQNKKTMKKSALYRYTSKLARKPKGNKIKRKRLRLKEYKLTNTLVSPTIVNKKTFIFNKRIFAYQFRHHLKYYPKLLNNHSSTNVIIDLLKVLLCRLFAILKKKIVKIQKTIKKLRKIRYNKRRKINTYKVFKATKKRYRFKLISSLRFFRKIQKKLYKRSIGFSKAIIKKYHQKAKYFNKICISRNDINNKLTCGLLYDIKLSKNLIILLKNSN